MSSKQLAGGYNRMHRHNITVTDAQWNALQEEAFRSGRRSASAVVQAHAESLSRKHARQDAKQK